MATTVYDTVEIELSDKTTLVLKPLPIKQLRKFMEIIRSIDKLAEDDEQGMEIFIQGAMICLENIRPDLSTDKDKFENLIEVPTMMKILEVCGGLKLTDPNLLGAALVGTN